MKAHIKDDSAPLRVPPHQCCDTASAVEADQCTARAARRDMCALIGLDLDRLLALIACAGPACAAEMQACFLADLAKVETGLSAASSLADAERHAHALTGLSGQAGAQGLARQAETLLRAAQRQDAGAVQRLMPTALAGTAALAAVIAGLSTAPDHLPKTVPS